MYILKEKIAHFTALRVKKTDILLMGLLYRTFILFSIIHQNFMFVEYTSPGWLLLVKFNFIRKSEWCPSPNKTKKKINFYMFNAYGTYKSKEIEIKHYLHFRKFKV